MRQSESPGGAPPSTSRQHPPSPPKVRQAASAAHSPRRPRHASRPVRPAARCSPAARRRAPPGVRHVFASRALGRSRFPASRTRRRASRFCAGSVHRRCRPRCAADRSRSGNRPRRSARPSWPCAGAGSWRPVHVFASATARGERERGGLRRDSVQRATDGPMAAVSRIANARTVAPSTDAGRRAPCDAALRRRWCTRASRASSRCPAWRTAAASRARSGARCRR